MTAAGSAARLNSVIETPPPAWMGYGPRMRANEPAEGASNSFLWGPQRQIVIRPCPTCEKATLGTVQGACDEVPTDEHFFEPVRYSLVSCTTCGGVSLVSEDLQYEMLDPVRVGPRIRPSHSVRAFPRRFDGNSSKHGVASRAGTTRQQPSWCAAYWKACAATRESVPRDS